MSTPRPFELCLIGVVGVALATSTARASPPPVAETTPVDDTLAGYRERFRLGMQYYAAGALPDAIKFWEPIYRELGAERGYRLAYDLGIAYAELDDATPAAERLGEFMTEVDRRRARGEALAAIVEKEDADARTRMAALLAAKGRIRVDPGVPARPVQVDAIEPRRGGFTAWVTPGEHAVTFAAGSRDAHTKTVRVLAGEILDVAPSETPRENPPAAPSSDTRDIRVAPARDDPSAPFARVGPAVEASARPEVRRPFSPTVIAVSGGLAAAGAIVAVPLADHAWSLRDRYAGEVPVIPSGDRQRFSDARTLAYVAAGAAAAMGLVTGALTAWYFLGSSKRDAVVRPAAGPERGGASVGIVGQF